MALTIGAFFTDQPVADCSFTRSAGDQVVEWNGVELTGRTYEEVQQITSMANGEIELVIRPYVPRSQAPRLPIPQVPHTNPAPRVLKAASRSVLSLASKPHLKNRPQV